MKHQPFKDLDRLIAGKNSPLKEGSMVQAQTVKKGRSTKAEVDAAVKKARKILREHPGKTIKEVALEVGIGHATISRHLQKKVSKKVAKKSVPVHPDKFIELTNNFNNAKAEYENAREELIAFIQSGSL